MAYNKNKSFLENLATGVTARMIVDSYNPNLSLFKRALAVTLVKTGIEGNERFREEKKEDKDKKNY